MFRAQAFHSLINKIIDNGKDLKKIKNFEFHGFNKMPISFWNKFLYSVEHKERSMELSEEIENISANLLTPGEWNELSMYLVFFGFFKLGYICRMKSYSSLEHYCKIFPLNIFYIRAYIISLLERGDYLKAKETYNKIIIFKNSEFDFYFKSLFLYDESKAKKYDPKFHELVNNKRIAVVGPLNSKENNGNEIDSSDLVVRINQNYETQEKFKKNKEGSKTDIVYYNNYFGKQYYKDNFKQIPKNINIKCLVFRNSINYNGEIYSRAHIESNSMVYNGGFTMGQIIIFDLLPFCPRSLKIYGVDFYTSQNKYSASYYSNSFDITFLKLLDAHALHDIFTQFIFAKIFFERNLIVGDMIYTKVLSMSLEEYLSKMEEIYPVHRIN